MLYKLGLTYKRQEYHKKELEQLIDDRLEKSRDSVKHSFREINEFISTFHKDFTDYAHL